MAKKDGRKSSVKKEKSRRDREVSGLAAKLKEIRKENDKLSRRVKKLEDDDRLVKRVRTLERDHSKSIRRMDSLAEELKRTKSVASSVGRKKAKSSKSAASVRPNEESEPTITKAARKKAVEVGVDLSRVKGTGTEGRITVRDVRKKAGKKSAGKSSRSRKAAKR